MNGFFAQNRHWWARVGALFPRVTLTLMGLKWLVWLAFGWPIAVGVATFTALLFVLTTALWVLPHVPWGALFGLTAALLSLWLTNGRAGAVLAAIMIGGAVGASFYWRHKNDFPYVELAWHIAKYALPTLAFFGTLATVDWRIPATLAAVALIAWSAEMFIANGDAHWQRAWRLRRLYAEVRREFPNHWTDLAARSKRIQSIDQSIERTVSQSAKDRPILEHPAMGTLLDTWFDVDEFAVWVPIARPEGRSVEALQEVVDEWGAQFFTISDAPEAIRLIWPDRNESNFASWVWVRIQFAERRPGMPRPRLGTKEPAPVAPAVDSWDSLDDNEIAMGEVA